MNDFDRSLIWLNLALPVAAASLILMWVVVSGYPFDGWVLTILGVNTLGATSTYLTRSRPELSTSPAAVVSTAVVLAVYMPFYADHLEMLIFPTLAGVSLGAVFGTTVLAGCLLPAAIVLAWSTIDASGVRQGLATTLLAYALWVAVGAISHWFRTQLRSLRQETVLQSRHEIEERRSLATSLRASVTEVGTATVAIEQQSSTIAASVEQLAMSIRRAAETASGTELSLREVTVSTSQSQESIARLETAGREIVGIVDTITELSHQTNMLALNATIEAARAGETGRGFAVVANEVKDLARSTAESAAGIGAVVDQIQARVAESIAAISDIVDQVAELEAGQRELNASVNEQTDVVAGISTAAFGSVASVSRIGDTIRQLEDQAARLTAAQS